MRRGAKVLARAACVALAAAFAAFAAGCIVVELNPNPGYGTLGSGYQPGTAGPGGSGSGASGAPGIGVPNYGTAFANMNAADRATVEDLGYLTRHQLVTKDKLTWSFDEQTGTLYITGSGPMKDYEYTEAPWADVAYQTRYIDVADGITSIGAYAFCDFWALEFAFLPDSVEYIGEYAFLGCYVLEDIPFPANLKEIGAYAFAECKVHLPLVIPEGVQILGPGAFFANDFTYTISIPQSMEYIAEGAFADSLHVTEFKVSPQNPNYTASGGVLFDKDQTLLLSYPVLKTDAVYEIPGTVTRIGADAFDLSFFLRKLVFPDALLEVEPDQFGLLRGLEEFVVGEGCAALMTVNGALLSKDGTVLYAVPKGVHYANFAIPDGVEYVPFRAFSEADIDELRVPEGIRYVGSSAFGTMVHAAIYLPESFVDTVEFIASDAFMSGADTTYDMAAGVKFTPTSDGLYDLEYKTKPMYPAKVYYAGSQAKWDAFCAEFYLDFWETEVICAG